MDGVRITNRPAWLAAVARRLASEFHDFIANGLDGTTGDDIVISLGAQVAAASLGIEQPDQGLAASAARRFGMAIASAQAAAGDLDPDSANEEIEATSSDPAWRLAAFTAYTDATSCTPVPRLLAPADEA